MTIQAHGGILDPRRPAMHVRLATHLFVVLCVSSLNASAAELRLRFVHDGDPPAPKPIVADRDKEVCGKFNLIDERLLVNPENRGIQNVVVYLYTGRGGTKLDPLPPRNEEVQLTAENCQFHPRVVVAQAGDTLVFDSKSQVGHNLTASFFRNPALSMVIPPGGAARLPLASPEPVPLPLKCNVHPWMNGYLILLEHTFVGVSDADGHVVIPGLPADTELVFRFFHEAIDGRATNVKVNGAEATWQRQRFSITTNDGVTDVGTVSLSLDAFAEKKE